MGTEDKAAIGLVIFLGLVTALWTAAMGLQFQGNMVQVYLAGAVLAGLGAIYGRYRPKMARLANLVLYSGLWVIWSTTADILTYAVAAWNFPLRDASLSAWDRALGFDWLGAFNWVNGHPGLLFIAQQAYHSYYLQAVLCIGILAVWGEPRANARLLMAATIAFTITLIISGLWPSLGPAEFNHLTTAWGQIVRDLRAGSPGPYYIIGIINFPSFHAIMAILYTLAQWPNKLRFYCFAALNIVLVLATPFVGGHYLVDVLAGFAIALASWSLSNRAINLAPRRSQISTAAVPEAP